MTLFRSFFMAGFECSSHRLGSGKRLDMISITRHDEYAHKDFRRMREMGMSAARSGIRWHLIEPRPGHYDFSSIVPMLRAARDFDIQVVWDLLHYGYPDDLDIFSPAFVSRFARMVKAFTRVYSSETDAPAFFCPVNEISFFSWGGGDVGYLNPFAHGRGFELKVQLARAAIEAIEAVWEILPDVRIVHADPVINIIPLPQRPHESEEAEGHRLAQYQGWDLISGRMWPQIGGNPKYLDILGLNYYSNNQWFNQGPVIQRGDPLYRPFRDLLREVHERYHRPIFIAETGIEDDARPNWLRYVCDETAAAIESGIPIHGLCLYPILNHPGWDDERHCYNGLWDYADDNGTREVCEPLADELLLQQKRMAGVLAAHPLPAAPAPARPRAERPRQQIAS
jgi:polysaccharide biosynthesis protein PelF